MNAPVRVFARRAGDADSVSAPHRMESIATRDARGNRVAPASRSVDIATSLTILCPRAHATLPENAAQKSTIELQATFIPRARPQASRPHSKISLWSRRGGLYRL